MRLRRLAVMIGAAISILAVSGTAMAQTVNQDQAAQVTEAARPPVTSTFDFSNGDIAHFSATLTFHSRYSFTISNVRLSDTNCDQRSALALVQDQEGSFAKGVDPAVYTWKNDFGCGTTLDGTTYTFEGGDEVQYIEIRLYAANRNGASRPAYSARHANPHY